MTRAQPTMFDGMRLTLDDAIELTIQSMLTYGLDHEHWALAWSGGKDSTATLTLILHLIETERLPRPRSLTIFYADTRLELTPLAIAAQLIIDRLRNMEGVAVEVVCAPLDKRFLVYMLGRGVPPPSNTFRWCTPNIKVLPMQDALAMRLDSLGTALMITGVRQGESAARDDRIAMSCGKDGAECGQGWYQQVVPEATGIRGRIATLAPLLHWRVCHIWDWLRFHVDPRWRDATAMIADAYGGDEAEETNARTGCIGCPLASRDLALERVIRRPGWQYLAPLAGLKPIYRELRKPRWRLKKTGINEDGSIALAKNKQRMGPLTFEARLMALDQILAIQAQVNEGARRLGRPEIDILNVEEENRIRELISAGTWPNGWAGDEPTADTLMDMVYGDGSVLPLLL